MHTESTNLKHEYIMDSQKLESTQEEKDIGVIITENLRPAEKCAKVAKTAQTVLSQISRAFHYRDRHIFIRFYKLYVWPHLEFSSQAKCR
jgi:hypothetical protein